MTVRIVKGKQPEVENVIRNIAPLMVIIKIGQNSESVHIRVVEELKCEEENVCLLSTEVNPAK